jgi:pimeloyl-ACP methyl ester carboxylesterase
MGTAQTIPAYSANIQALSRKHRVIIIELRGQGSTELSSSYATTKQQIADIHNILPKIIGHQTPIHLAGYSFGGRIALAYAAHHPSFVSRLSITGVPLQRSATGRIIIRSWLEALQRNNLRDCAWSLVLNGYSDEMLSKMEKKIGSAVDYIVEANDPVRLYDLIRLSHELDPQSAFAVHNCALQIKCPTQVIAGRYDRIAGFDETVKLSQTIPGAQLVSFDAGHSIPFEKTSQWCRTLSDFLLQ